MSNERPNDLLFVDSYLTPLTEIGAAWALREAWFVCFDVYPSIDSLSLIWAQTALETGRWKKIYNYNWGNIKRRESKPYTSYGCNEILNGKVEWFQPYHPQTFFAAYSSAAEGAQDYLKLLSQLPRYQKCWQTILIGSAPKFGLELHAAGYYTDDVTKYTKNLVELDSEFKNKFNQNSFTILVPPITLPNLDNVEND